MNYNQLNHLHALSRLLDQADRLNTLADQINPDGTTGPQVVDIAIGSRDTRARRIDLMRSYDGSNGGSPCLEGLRYAPALAAEEEKISGKVRIVIDLGDLKGEAVRASRKRKMKLAPWIREAVEEKIERES